MNDELNKEKNKNIKKHILNFCVGPVMMENDIKEIGGADIPYFRTTEFSNVMIENEKKFLKFVGADKQSKLITLCSSGTGAMESTIINCINKNDKTLIIDGGSFGNRFCEIFKTNNLKFTSIKCENGKQISKDQLKEYENKNYACLVINMHETSTGLLYDMKLISDFCKRNNIFLVVDAISSFLADELNMKQLGINALIMSSQKALALPPGCSFVVLDQQALKRVTVNKCKSYYFDFKKYLIDAKRGQTPFTPSVGIILQLNKRLKNIDKNGGANSEIKKTKILASYFRQEILNKKLPFKVYCDNCSNAVTSLRTNSNAYNIFEILKNEYNIFVCPNGGDLKEKVFRVGHIGNITKKDIDILIKAFVDMRKRKLL